MPRLAILNMLIGFLVVVLAAFAGVFNAFTMTEGYLKDQALLGSWQLVLMNSAHGHTNLFGFLHVLFGLTMPYSVFSQRIKVGQTVAIFLGAVAMGPGMMVRAALGPSESLDAWGIVIGTLLFASLCGLLAHAAGLLQKLLQRSA